jgi:hypothetical protein
MTRLSATFRNDVKRRKHEIFPQQGRHLAWKADGKGGEVALQSRVDGEAACRGVHARDVLAVVDCDRTLRTEYAVNRKISFTLFFTFVNTYIQT